MLTYYLATHGVLYVDILFNYTQYMICWHSYYLSTNGFWYVAI